MVEYTFESSQERASLGRCDGQPYLWLRELFLAEEKKEAG